MAETQLTSKGQITLPKEIRDYLKVKSGDRVSFFVEKDGRVTVSPSTQPVSSLKGMISAKKSISLEEMDRAIHRRASKS